jgi:nucleotide-binding universal stress UspA family protein
MIRNILLPTELGPASREAEDMARDVARAFGASILALHAIEPIDPGGDEDPFADFYRGLRRRSTRRMAELRKRMASSRVPCRTEVVVAERWRAILDVAARESSDLIVMGSRPAVSEGKLDLGTTSHRVFLAAKVPLLVVRREARPS